LVTPLGFVLSGVLAAAGGGGGGQEIITPPHAHADADATAAAGASMRCINRDHVVMTKKPVLQVAVWRQKIVRTG